MTALEICGNRIIIGFDSGEIKIYNSVDLQCESTLPYGVKNCVVRCFQSTCTEIIAGYDNGLVCVWNIQSGLLMTILPEGTVLDSSEAVSCMRWRKPHLVVGKENGKIGIWQWSNTSFMLLGQWDSNVGRVKRVEFDLEHVIVLEFGSVDAA